MFYLFFCFFLGVLFYVAFTVAVTHTHTHKKGVDGGWRNILANFSNCFMRLLIFRRMFFFKFSSLFFFRGTSIITIEFRLNLLRKGKTSSSLRWCVTFFDSKRFAPDSRESLKIGNADAMGTRIWPGASASYADVLWAFPFGYIYMWLCVCVCGGCV